VPLLRAAGHDVEAIDLPGVDRRMPAAEVTFESYVAALIGDGWLGEVLSVDLLSSIRAWGAEIPPSGAYLHDARNGATLPSIIGGHSLDMVAACVGQFDIVHGMTLNRYRRGRDTATGEIIEKTSPDQLLVHARLANGAPVSAHIQGACTARMPSPPPSGASGARFGWRARPCPRSCHRRSAVRRSAAANWCRSRFRKRAHFRADRKKASIICDRALHDGFAEPASFRGSLARHG